MASPTKRKTTTKKAAKKAAGKTGKVVSAKSGKKSAKKAATRSKRTTSKTSKVKEPDRSAPPMAEVDTDVLEFIAAIDRFKQEHGRPFPNWSEVLMVVKQLGYRRD